MMSDDLFANLRLQGDSLGLLANPTPRKIEINSLLIADKTFQFRISTPDGSLEESMREAGSLTPIKIMPLDGHDGYIILDGHCRVAAAVRLDWKEIWAFMYPMLSEPQARWVSYVSNTGRKNLTIVDRANFALMARKRGDDDKTIEQVTQRKMRTIQRYLKISPALLEYFDGYVVNLSHLQCIEGVDSGVVGEKLEFMIETIKGDRLDSREFKKWLRAQGWLKKSPGRRRKIFGSMGSDHITIRGLTIRKSARRARMLAAYEFLTRARQHLQDWLGAEARDMNTSGLDSEHDRNCVVETPAVRPEKQEMDPT